MTKRVLILGGTGDSSELAGRLVADGHHVVSSLAGVTSRPVMPAGEVRVGGFGGAGGLAEYVAREGFDLIVDATHPYAVQISANGASASGISGVPYLRFERPAWQAEDGDQWISARDTADAVARLDPGACAFVTIGRKEIGRFAVREDVRVVARMIEPPDGDLPADWRIILARPPFSFADEVALMRLQEVTVLVSKNAGGPARAKIDAARRLGVPVIMIERPAKPAAKVFTTLDEMAAAVAGEGT
ncbi:MAG: cobalt-precorrin-6A reductase [Aestuariivirgaceae bacterium]